MKIPDTSANVGAYYGNEEGGQWQPNGVIIDSGVGGGVVGSGDAGIHRPPVYPVHIPRGHIPGYVMAGAFYPPAPFAAPAPAPADDFEDYMWMENEEEFDKQVMQQLEEEALMEQCIEAMLEDEQREQRTRAHNGHYPTTSNGNPLSLEETVSRSTLNPLAAEFVPTARPAPPQPTPTATPTQATAPPATQDAPPTQHFCTNKEEDTESMVAQPPSEDETDARTDADTPPETEVSESASRTDAGEAPAEAEAGGDKRPKPDKRDAKAKDAKKPVVKQAEVKPKAVRPDTRPAKRTPAPRREDDAPVPKPTPPTEESSPVPAGPKPINYAAAARANKPKPKAAPAPATPAPTPAPKSDKKEKPKVDKPVQRKNSTK